MNGISIVVPILNEEENIGSLIERVHAVMQGESFPYELIFVDDHSTDETKTTVDFYKKQYPVRFYLKKGEKGKAQSLLEGFSYAKYDLLCMIDGDLQYPPEAIPDMIRKVKRGADIVVGNRKLKHEVSRKRRIMSSIYAYFFNKKLHNLPYDVQSGLKIFRKEIVSRIRLHPAAWSFDLSFLLKAKDAGYSIESHDIVFSKRHNGESKVKTFATSAQIAYDAIKQKFVPSDIIPFSKGKAVEKGNGFHYKGQEFVHFSDLHHFESAFHRLSQKQKITGVVSILLIGISLLLNWHTTLIVVVGVITFLYFLDLLFNLFLIFRSFFKPAEVEVERDELDAIHKSIWPKYTVFCPLYKEWQVLPQFISAMSRLDYPKEKLQVMLLLEEDDKETIKHVMQYDLPEYFDIVIVPNTRPKTKPKACNYGLRFATGEYVVIYDAEDAPDPLQLKKAVVAFAKTDDTVICIQAKLNFYNPHQNLLTRVFTAEYSLWFDLVLTGLQSIQAPIPLGGTSNHFRKDDLQKLKGWDSFNVTEDCDLGIRLVKKGYKTAIISSETLEEANSSLPNWFWQRTRWIKGYMQTYLLHMRNPLQFAGGWSNPHLFTFQLVVGGKVLSMLINPFMWMITISYFAFRPYIGTFIETFFPGPILYMGVLSLVMGNFLYMYYYMIGCAKHKQYELIKYTFIVPFYWLAMSAAAWVAAYKLIVAPHHWSKTKHGLHLQNQKAGSQSTDALGEPFINSTGIPMHLEEKYA